MRMFIPLALVTLTALVAFPAQAEAQTDPQPDDQAWVDDCPPDMMCAATAGPDEPVAYGNDTCIECSGVVDDDPAAQPQTCMDGAQEGEACDDVQYFGPGPADTGIEPSPQPESAADEASGRDAPLLPTAVLVVAVLALVALRRRA